MIKNLRMLWILFQVLPILGIKSGPFKSSCIRVGPCTTLTQPVDNDPPSYLFAELYNTTVDTNLLRGNITILRKHRLKKMKTKSFVMQNGKWKVNYLINNMGCNHIFFPVLCNAIGVKYDTKSCSFYKGEYVFDNFNLNKIQHIWMRTQEYGRILWRIEATSNIGTVFCFDFETLVEQL